LLYKAYFPADGLRGAASAARLLYLVNPGQRQIVLVWIYTHKQYAKRPPEKDIDWALRVAMAMEGF
jgi:hypothetical protein